jgi:3-deoxy-D-manno-octulosonic-acid transferase
LVQTAWPKSTVVRQLLGRQEIPALARDLLKIRRPYTSCRIFFCSSAGEYEQARPLIDRFARDNQTLIVVFLYSQSGLKYVHARHDLVYASVHCLLTPFSDSPWDWGWLFAVLRPHSIYLVRHEIWPGFLMTAQAYGAVFLICASVQKKSGLLSRLLKNRLYQYFDRIYCVSENDQTQFMELYGIHPGRLFVTGDTKYDRVRERANASENSVELWRNTIQKFAPQGAQRRVFVAGSIYPVDLALLLPAFLKISPPTEPPVGADSPWTLVLVPHHIHPEAIQKILEQCQVYQLSPLLTSQLSSAEDNPRVPFKESCVFIVDQMGFLAEIYGIAHAAYVGGALHHQVHNILEPAVRGLPLAWGPSYHNSQEAEFFVKASLAKVVSSPNDFYLWWESLDSKQLSLQKAQFDAAVNGMLGATSKIIQDGQTLVPKQVGRVFIKP